MQKYAKNIVEISTFMYSKFLFFFTFSFTFGNKFKIENNVSANTDVPSVSQRGFSPLRNSSWVGPLQRKSNLVTTTTHLNGAAVEGTDQSERVELPIAPRESSKRFLCDALILSRAKISSLIFSRHPRSSTNHGRKVGN